MKATQPRTIWKGLKYIAMKNECKHGQLKLKFAASGFSVERRMAQYQAKEARRFLAAEFGADEAFLIEMNLTSDQVEELKPKVRAFCGERWMR